MSFTCHIPFHQLERLALQKNSPKHDTTRLTIHKMAILLKYLNFFMNKRWRIMSTTQVSMTEMLTSPLTSRQGNEVYISMRNENIYLQV